MNDTNKLPLDQVFDRAADELLLHGWTQDEYGADDGPKCTEGAVLYVLKGTIGGAVLPWDVPRICEIDELLHSVIGCDLDDAPYLDTADWNDSAGRTIDDAVELLRKAAKVCREKNSD